jgi:short-subunit dehydrogenase
LPIYLASAEELDGVIDRMEDLGGPVSVLINNAALAVAGRSSPTWSWRTAATRC